MDRNANVGGFDFSSLTPQMAYMMKSGMNNFGQSFKQNDVMIDKTNFVNRDNVVHNNLGDNVSSERVAEYTVRVSSGDRTVLVYPSPFKFAVSFGVPGVGNVYRFRADDGSRSGTVMSGDLGSYYKYGSGHTESCPLSCRVDHPVRNHTGYLFDNSVGQNGKNNFVVGIHGKPVIVNDLGDPVVGIGGTSVPRLVCEPVRPGTPSPTISQKFMNVKYVTLDSVILPKTLAISVSGRNKLPECVYPITNEKNVSRYSLLTNHRCLHLRVKELNTNYLCATNPDLETTTFILVPDKCLGMDSHLWVPLDRAVTFKYSLLDNVNQLTFELLDENGNELCFYGENGWNIDKRGANVIPFEFYNNLVMLNECSEGGFQGCIDGMRYTNSVMQVQYNLFIGVVEMDMNTLPSFRP